MSKGLRLKSFENQAVLGEIFALKKSSQEAKNFIPPWGGAMAPWGHWPIGSVTLSQPHFKGGVDT